ncbi:MAG: LexA family transcriptional regulator [Oscillospiraceae bacterium]|nr:LexA family transcriptional regulator [Oscillospiraceae bacterium]
MDTIDRIIVLLNERNLSQKDLTDHLEIKKSVFSAWKVGKSHSYKKYIKKIADFLNTTPSYLMGWDDEASALAAAIREDPSIIGFKKKENDGVDAEPIKSNIDAVFTDNIRMIPLYNSVSAGLGATAQDEIVDFIPLRIRSDYEAAETICIRVKGDSMSPKIDDGDIIQVQKISSVDSGSIAVVLLDGDEGLVKKVEYGKDWIELHSFNPYYPVRRFEGAEVLRLQVVGLVKKIIKDV